MWVLVCVSLVAHDVACDFSLHFQSFSHTLTSKSGVGGRCRATDCPSGKTGAPGCGWAFPRAGGPVALGSGGAHGAPERL